MFESRESPNHSSLKPDPSIINWLEGSQVVPGGVACGFINAPLSYEKNTDQSFPKVKVYACIRFANVQPSPLGAVFGHAGGPLTLNLDGLNVLDGHGPDFVDNYDVIGIDQRGLGRSLPSFRAKSCKRLYSGSSGKDGEEFGLRLFLRKWENTTKTCWEDPSFHLTGPDGTPYHWLQYSGTTQLVGDINLLRTAIGLRKLSFHTVSYGTTVAGLYATMYPEHVDKLVLDSTTKPIPDGYKMSWDKADGAQKVWSMISGCTC